MADPGPKGPSGRRVAVGMRQGREPGQGMWRGARAAPNGALKVERARGVAGWEGGSNSPWPTVGLTEHLAALCGHALGEEELVDPLTHVLLHGDVSSSRPKREKDRCLRGVHIFRGLKYLRSHYRKKKLIVSETSGAWA